ncbi:hypothetical protein [Methanomethylovorans sp.]|uniref:hypothetical protein n=1 Tax=Methanomethylovorans sp. TaxID=2758717 RepID=UPI002FDEC7FA
MNKILLMVFLGFILLVAGCTEKPAEKPGIVNEATINHRTYGGFVMQNMAIQELMINTTAVTLSYYSPTYELTQRSIKPLNASTREDLLQLFRDNDFLEMNATYVPQPGQPVVTDVGIVEISLLQKDFNKTVKVDPYSQEYMPEDLKEIDQALVDLKQYALTISAAEAETIAEEWIKNAPTYKYDGSELTLVNSVVMGSFPEQYSMTYSFISGHAGYGNRSGQMTAEVITDHTVNIKMFQGLVTSAIIDGVWDEMNQQMLQNERILLQYPNMPCNETPWVKWYAEANIQFFKAPTGSELIIAYYSNVYGIEVTDIAENTVDSAQCSYTLKVIPADAEAMKDMGWQNT